MIPLRDDVPSRTFPFVNIVLIALNAFAFLMELGMGRGLERFVYQAAVVPALFTGADHVLSPLDVLRTTLDPDLGGRVLVSMFLHAGWPHLLGNMLYLWIFGDNVEDRLGHFRYLVFYLLCGWAASYAHIWSDPLSKIPSLGASGAIAGVLGAYMTLYPQARVVTLLPLGLFTQFVQIPAVFFLGFWFLQQFLSGTLSLAVRTAQSGGVAWWATSAASSPVSPSSGSSRGRIAVRRPGTHGGWTRLAAGASGDGEGDAPRAAPAFDLGGGFT